MRSWALRIIKWCVIGLLLVASYKVVANQFPYELIKRFNRDNVPIIAIKNNTNRVLYCAIEGQNYFVDFYVRPNKTGRWYFEPYGGYIYKCI